MHGLGNEPQEGRKEKAANNAAAAPFSLCQLIDYGCPGGDTVPPVLRLALPEVMVPEPDVPEGRVEPERLTPACPCVSFTDTLAPGLLGVAPA
jgi:hypothetical protein